MVRDGERDNVGQLLIWILSARFCDIQGRSAQNRKIDAPRKVTWRNGASFMLSHHTPSSVSRAMDEKAGM